MDVVVVGDRAFVERVRCVLPEHGAGGSVRIVDGYLMALGEISKRRPDVVIGSTDGLGRSPGVTAGALKQLAPAAKLLVIGNKDSQHIAEHAVAEGFDGLLVEPLQGDSLIQAIERAGDMQLIEPCVLIDQETKKTVRSAHPNDRRRERFPETPVVVVGGGQGKGHIAGLSKPNVQGDDALVELLLNRKRGLREAAIGLLNERSGLDFCRYESAQGVPLGGASIELEHDGQGYGVLWSPQLVERETLVNSGQWLAKWCALGERFDVLWEQSLRDDLTGTWNRRYFRKYLEKILRRAAEERFSVTVMVYDLDDFKGYNDRYGHAAGDEILQETARLMRSVVREHDVVARIGGDEFAVIFWDADSPRHPNSHHPADVLKVAERFRKAIYAHRFPKLSTEAPGKLTISGGLASYPWDGRTPQELIEQADLMAMRSKRQGKNAITLGPGAIRDSSDK